MIAKVAPRAEGEAFAPTARSLPLPRKEHLIFVSFWLGRLCRVAFVLAVFLCGGAATAKSSASDTSTLNAPASNAPASAGASPSVVSVAPAGVAPSVVETPLVQKCLQRADALPDLAAAEAAAWIKKGGGNDAHLCHAFAQVNRGMHADAAHEFWSLADFYDAHDARRAVLMHIMSGQEFMQAKDNASADVQYTAVLKIMPTNVLALIGRAKLEMSDDRDWDALDALTKALRIDPENVDALRQRGRAWTKLGNTHNAHEDFARADELTSVPRAK